MKRIIIFGKSSTILERTSSKDHVRLHDNKIVITRRRQPSDSLLGAFLADLLHSQLLKIYDQIRMEGKVEVFGNLDFEIVKKIDGKKRRIAKLKGNKILVKSNAVALPKSALRYIIAHEIAHLFTKKHAKRFWMILKTIYPGFRRGQELFMKYEKFLT